MAKYGQTRADLRLRMSCAVIFINVFPFLVVSTIDKEHPQELIEIPIGQVFDSFIV